MAATTNFQNNTIAGTKFLAPQCSKTTIKMIVVAYLLTVGVMLLMTAGPFQSASAIDFGVAPQPVSYSSFVSVEIPGVHVPTAPYIYFDTDTNKIIIALENPEVMPKASALSNEVTRNGIEGGNDSLEPLQTWLRESH